MHDSPEMLRVRGMLALLAFVVVAITSGCSRAKYRIQADREAYAVIAERNADPRWCATDFGIDMDSRSRFYDPYNPDRSPMPADDPASHQYMQAVDGKKGWSHWDDNGERIGLENPAWVGALTDYVDVAQDDAVKLNVDSALQLAYMHSPAQQTQLETLYLSALDVTAERFRLDTQFFGGYDAKYEHLGSLIPPALRYDPVLGRFVVTPPIHGAGVENNRVTVGRPFGVDPALQARRHFATAGELLVGFANSFVFEFTGNDSNLAASLANFSFIQPLLRGAGKDVALEQLTLAERGLLADLRAYYQYRQGFYTQVAIGELGVVGPQRGNNSTRLVSYSGQSFIGGYVGLLQQLQQIRNAEDNLSLQQRTLDQLVALLNVGIIDLVQVDQFRQNIFTDKARLLQSRNDFALALDRYKTLTLGLPPDVPVELDDQLIRQFQLVAREATAVQDSIIALRDRVGQLPNDATIDLLRPILDDFFAMLKLAERQLNDTRGDLVRMKAAVPARERFMDDDERQQYRQDREHLAETLADLQQQFQAAETALNQLQDSLSTEAPAVVERRLTIWLNSMLRLVQRSILVQARARLDTVTIDTVELQPRDAFDIALANRLDFMNARASLVDSWRSIQVNADALQSVLNVTADGNLRTARNNPISFRAPTANLRMGFEFDAPFTRLLERNAYRESLINYQQSRRGFIQSCDALHLGVRQLLREIEQLRKSLEIQRSAVAIAIQRVDMTRASLYAPVPPPRPGQRAAQFGPTAAINLLSAQSALRDTQNAFLGVWLNYYAAKMRLAREMGVMLLDRDGAWMENAINGDPAAPEELPPPVPADLIEAVNSDPLPPPAAPVETPAEAGDGAAADRPNE
ncbi:MAG: TolC family protein [Pirellulaceae bacterium]